MKSPLFLSRLRGKICRWYRKTFHHKWDVVDHGLSFFQEFADIYGNSINDIESAERFFKDFMDETEGWVIVDFLDTNNWDCIRRIEVDKQNGLIWFYWQIPHEDPVAEQMKRMVFPLHYYGMCLKFDQVRFVRDKKNKCFGICVNGFTIRERNVKGFAKKDGWQIKGFDAKTSFFSANLVREKDGVFQHWRFMNTPICSFWIIPKQINVRPEDSEKLLYSIGVDKCEEDLKGAFLKTKGCDKLSVEEQRKVIKSSAHEMRTVAESLFKLIMCFYQEQYRFQVNNYDDLRLGDLTGPLKKNVYREDFEQNRIDEIPRLANDLSHDSGNPVDFKDLGMLFTDIFYFVGDFRSQIRRKGRVMEIPKSDKPSPHDYVKEHFKEFCFVNEINESIHNKSGKISYTIKADVGTFIDFFEEERIQYVLCVDGYIRDSREEGIETLKVWGREDVIALMEKMYQRVTEICDANGFDTEIYSLGISFEAKLKKEGAPSHLFNEKEIEDLMRNADDGQFNKLVIDEEGVAHIIQNTRNGYLYPVSQETWDAGNMYVGKDSSLSDLHDSYVLCMHLWLAYLKTGCQMYDDIYIPDGNLDEVIDEVKEYYT